MAKRPTIHDQSGLLDDPAFITGDFAMFAHHLGYVTWAWNALHMDLCDLFCLITGWDNPNISRAIWYAIKSDSGQRDILKAAANIALEDKTECRDEVLWLTQEVDQLAGFRNDAFHVGWTTEFLGMQKEAKRHPFELRRAIPDVVRGHPRGTRLADKDAGAIFRALADHCLTLMQFTRFIDTHVIGADEGKPLPERPVRPPVLRPGSHS
jgi:hypothetical protein